MEGKEPGTVLLARPEGNLGASYCDHAKEECNGCPLMGLEYGNQLEAKQKILFDIFGEKIEIEPSPSELRYRNKAELSYINGLLGYKRRGNFFESFELKDCLLLSEKANQIVQFISSDLKKRQIQSASIMQRKPGLGYVCIRQGENEQMMVNFIFFGQVDGNIEALCNELLEKEVKSVNIILNETWSDTAFGKMIQTFGEKFIIDEILGKKFQIAPETFFQTNKKSAQKIFSVVQENIPIGSRVLDLYCGVGTIGIAIAQKCKNVVGIEVNEQSVASAIMNAKNNGVENAIFYAGKAQEVLEYTPLEFDVVVVDPPRNGLEQQAIDCVLEISAQKIIYVSCNPTTLARDIAKLQGYEICNLRAFDQFPQTSHIEMLCVLEKK